MKNIKNQLTSALMICAVAFSAGTTAHESSHDKVHRRAVESVIYSQPLVGTHQTLNAIRDNGGDFNTVAYLSKPGDWKFRVLTPNNTVLYGAIMTNTAIDGKVVIELPDSKSGAILAGSILDSYQDPLNDIGLMGDDAGKGGKYLLFPAGDNSPAPEGYIAVRSQRNIAWTMLRFVPKSFSVEDLAKAEDVVKRIKVYPFSQAGNPQPTKFVDVYGKYFDTAMPLDSTYFDAMANMLNEETVTNFDKAFLGMMQTIGYQRGEDFAPSAQMREKLDHAMKDAKEELMQGVSDIAKPIWEGSQWSPLGRQPTFETGFSFITDNLLDYDLRGTMYSYVCCGGIKLGTSANLYLQTSKGETGEFLDGSKNYKLTVPANAPTTQFWSIMAYDAATAVYYKDVVRPGLSALDQNMQKNADGSVDIYLGPDAPKGFESNWLPTKKDSRPLLLFRLYGATAKAKDGSWVVPAFAEIQ